MSCKVRTSFLPCSSQSTIRSLRTTPSVQWRWIMELGRIANEAFGAPLRARLNIGAFLDLATRNWSKPALSVRLGCSKGLSQRLDSITVERIESCPRDRCPSMRRLATRPAPPLRENETWSTCTFMSLMPLVHTGKLTSQKSLRNQPQSPKGAG